MTIGYVTRKHKFDAAHRVMFEKVKCFNMHGHEYHLELTLSYNEIHSIGYAIDFKEIRRVGMSFIDKRFDHGAIYNPADIDFIEPCRKHNTKIHLMNLMGEGNFCNPSAENIVKELFFAFSKLLDNPQNCNLLVHSVKLYETVNCYVTCYRDTLSAQDWTNLESSQYARDIELYKKQMGEFEYDSRKASSNSIEVDSIEN
jgi:6-pyruvoyltetrahydropterin/6-carboxytetrahydropterin synthase